MTSMMNWANAATGAGACKVGAAAEHSFLTVRDVVELMNHHFAAHPSLVELPAVMARRHRRSERGARERPSNGRK